MPWGASPPYIPPKNNNFLKFLKVINYQSLNTIYWTKHYKKISKTIDKGIAECLLTLKFSRVL
jgi:hypothetical protein